jgi:hypothetical protein
MKRGCPLSSKYVLQFIAMKKLNTLIFWSAVGLNLISLPVSAQQESLKSREIDEKLAQAGRLSDEFKKNYSWNTRTDVTKEGKVMDLLIEEFSYGPDGRIQRKVINDQQAKLPSSFLVHEMAEEIKTRMVNFMNNLHLFLEEYALTDPSRRTAFFAKATIGPTDSEGQFLLSAKNVITKGDELLWWIDTHTYTLSKVSISTTFEGDEIEFTANYKYILPGVHYMAFAEILVPAKNITVMLHAYDYAKLN